MSSPKIILLHGWSTSSQYAQKWQPFRDALAAEHIESELLQIPGLSAPLDQVWSLADYTHWLEHQLGDETQVVLLGHSFGGQLAIRYTALHPQQVSKLILLDSSGIRSHAVLPTIKRNFFGVVARVGKVFFRHEFFRTVLYTLARERDYQTASPLLRRTMSNILDEEVLTDLPTIMCPTLLLWGSRDRVTPLWLARMLQKNIRAVRLQIIDGARHSPHYTHPQEVAQHVKVFIQERTIR